MFPRKLFFALAPILLFLILVTAPILTMSRDMWDGTIIEYASMVNNYSGLKNWFLESGWFLQFPLSLFIIETAQVTGLSYKNTNALFVFFVAVLLFRESKRSNPSVRYISAMECLSCPNENAAASLTSVMGSFKR